MSTKSYSILQKIGTVAMMATLCVVTVGFSVAMFS